MLKLRISLLLVALGALLAPVLVYPEVAVSTTPTEVVPTQQFDLTKLLLPTQTPPTPTITSLDDYFRYVAGVK